MLESIHQTLVTFLRRIVARQSLAGEAPQDRWTRDPLRDAEALYHNRHERLNIDFRVERIAFPAAQTMDPRVVRIAPGCNNELHRHAHESIFVLLEGEGEVMVGERRSALRRGDVAFVPRWVMHQTRNTSTREPLVLLAITDFGLTSTVLGNYDRRTRLRHGGADSRP